MRVPLRLVRRPRRRLRLRRISLRFDLRKALFILPNLFTVASIFCGFYAAITAASAAATSRPDDLYGACIAVLLAMVFDSVDGRVARLTRTQSDFGVQMDSLADVVSFGVVPALVAWHWGLSTYGHLGMAACFVFTACGAIRLARFNVLAARSPGATSSFFVGLPIPAAAGLLMAAIIAWLDAGAAPLDGTASWPPALLLGLGLVMVSTVPFRTFKAAHLDARTIAMLTLILGSLGLLAVRVRPSFAVICLMGGYLAYGLGEAVVRGFGRLFETAEPPEPPRPRDREGGGG